MWFKAQFLDPLFSFYLLMISSIALTLMRSIQLHVAFLLTTWNCTLPMKQPRIAHHCPTPLRTSKAGPINGNCLLTLRKVCLCSSAVVNMIVLCILFVINWLLRLTSFGTLVSHMIPSCVSMTTSTKLSVEHISGLICCLAHLFLKIFQF